MVFAKFFAFLGTALLLVLIALGIVFEVTPEKIFPALIVPSGFFAVSFTIALAEVARFMDKADEKFLGQRQSLDNCMHRAQDIQQLLRSRLPAANRGNEDEDDATA